MSEETRQRILKHKVEKHGRKRVTELAGVSRVTLWIILEKKSPVKPECVKPLLKLLSRHEFEELVTLGVLRSLDTVKEDGTID